MLYAMRKNAGSWLIKILLGAIVVVFVLWGGGNFKDEQKDIVATVNDEAILLADYQKEYNRLLEGVRQNFGGGLNEDVIRILGLKQRAIDALIERTLLLQKASELEFKVSDEELSAAIRDIPVFQTAGVFDHSLYTSILNRSRLTPGQFEFQFRKDILVEMVRNLIMGGVRVSDMEAMEWRKWESEARNIEFALFEPGQYKNITVSNDELNTFFQKNKMDYKTDPEMKASYLYFSPESFKKDVDVGDDDVESAFASMEKEAGAEFEKEKEGLREKLLEDRARELACDRAYDIYEEAFDVGDLGQLAGEAGMKTDVTGFFSRNSTALPGIKKPGQFISTAFSLSEDEISEPLDVGEGCYLLQAKERKPSEIPALDSVKARAKADLIKIKQDQAAEKEARESLVALKSQDASGVKVKKSKVALKTTGFFKRGAEIPEIGAERDISREAFALSEKARLPENVIKSPKGYYVIRLKGRKAPDADGFDAEKEALMKKLFESKQYRVLGSWLSALKQDSEILQHKKYFQ